MNFSSISLIKSFHLWAKEHFLDSFLSVTRLNLELSTDNAWSGVIWHVNLDIFDLEYNSHFLVRLKHRWSKLVLKQISNVSYFVWNISFFCFDLRITSLLLSGISRRVRLSCCFFIFFNNTFDFFLGARSNERSAFISYLLFLFKESLFMRFVFLVILSNFECCSDNNIWKIFVQALINFQLGLVELSDLICCTVFTNINFFLTNCNKALILSLGLSWSISDSYCNGSPFWLDFSTAVIKTSFLSEGLMKIDSASLDLVNFWEIDQITTDNQELHVLVLVGLLFFPVETDVVNSHLKHDILLCLGKSTDTSKHFFKLI